MSAKSSGSIVSAVLAIIVFAAFKFYGWHKTNELRTENAQRRLEARQKVKEDDKADIAFYEEVMRVGSHGDYNAMFNLFTNPPPSVSSTARGELKRYEPVLKRLVNLYKEIEDRSEADGLDLEEMLTPEFLTGKKGWRASKDRINRSLTFMNEIERRIVSLRAEMQSMKSPEANKYFKSPEANKYFNADKQWDAAMVSLRSSIDGMRKVAKSLLNLLSMHESHQSAWRWEDDDLLYFDPDFCDLVNAEKSKIAQLCEGVMESQNSLSAHQQEGMDKVNESMQQLKKQLR